MWYGYETEFFIFVDDYDSSSWTNDDLTEDYFLDNNIVGVEVNTRNDIRAKIYFMNQFDLTVYLMNNT
jgi:hypothetical protein